MNQRGRAKIFPSAVHFGSFIYVRKESKSRRIKVQTLLSIHLERDTQDVMNASPLRVGISKAIALAWWVRRRGWKRGTCRPDHALLEL